MKTRLKINEVAKMTGLSVNGIRFYEEKGIVRPTYVGRYRYYDLEAISELWRAVNYREMGFSVPEILELTHCDDQGKIKDALLKQQDRIESEIRSRQRVLQSIRSRIRRINEIEIQLGRCSQTRGPAYVICPTLRYEGEKMCSITENEDESCRCYACWGPDAAPSLLIDKQELNSDGDMVTALTGPGIRMDMLGKGQKKEAIEKGYTVIEEQTCIYTVLCLNNGVGLKRSYLQHVLDYAQQEGLEFCESAYTSRIAAVEKESDEQASYYVQAWFPVQEKI